MGKEEKNNKEANKIPAENGVIISVYVESPKLKSPQRTVTDAVKKTKPKSVSKKPQAARKRGYDRRAQLLAYARDLRNAGPQEVQQPINNLRSKPKPKPKKKWKWLMKPVSFCIQSHQTLERASSRWRYERMPKAIDQKNTEKVDRSIGGKKREPTRRSDSHFFSKLRCMLKELSCKKDDVGKDPKLIIAKSA